MLDSCIVDWLQPVYNRGRGWLTDPVIQSLETSSNLFLYVYVGYVEWKRKIDCPKMAHSLSLHWRWYWGGASKQVLGKIRAIDFYAIWHWSVFTASCSSVYCTFFPCESAAFPDILKCTDFPIQWMYLFWNWHPDSLSSWPCQYSIGHCLPEKLE